MLAAAILRAMKDNQKVQEPNNLSEAPQHESDVRTNLSVKDDPSFSGSPELKEDPPKVSSIQRQSLFKQNGILGKIQTAQIIRDETTTGNSAAITVSKKPSNENQDSPLSLIAPSPLLSAQQVHFEKGERPKDLVTLFKKNLDSGSEGPSPSQNSSPRLRSSPMRRTAIATMKRAREKLQITKLFMNLGKKASSSTQQWDPSMGSKISWTLKKEYKNVKDAEYIYECIKNFPFFSRFVAQALDEAEEMAILHICRSMKYETLSAGNYVFKEGDPSNDKLYIVLSGRVSVVLKSDSNVFMSENRGTVHEEKQISKPKDREPESPLNKDEELKFSRKNSENNFSQTNSKSTSPVSSLTSLKAHSIRKLSVFARSVARFSAIYKKKVDTIHETEEEHKQKIKDQVDRLKEIANKASEGRLIRTKSISIRGDLPRKNSRKKTKHQENQPVKLELGVINKEIKEGESFGERALTAKDSKRSASILTNTDCEFIVVMKKDYVNIMGRYNKEDRLKMEFLKQNLPYVDKISSSLVLQDYLYIFHTELGNRGKIVLEEGTVGEKVYMLVHGQIKLEKKVGYDSQFECTKSTKSIQIADLFAPAVFGEELLFGQNKYKYTVKIESQTAKIYYCSVDSLKIRFPKETLKSLKDSYEAKEDFHNNRLEFLKKKDKDTLLQAQNTESSQTDKLIDYRYRDLLNYAAFSSRTGLINKFRAIPDQLLNLKNSQSPDEIEEKKETFKEFTRNVSNIRQHVLQGKQKDIESFHEMRAKTANSAFKRNRSGSLRSGYNSPEPQATQDTMRTSRKEILEEKDCEDYKDDLSQPEKVELETKRSERIKEDRTPSPLSERRVQTELNSPEKLIQSPMLKTSSFMARKFKPEIQSEEMITVIAPRTANITESDGQSKRRYIIRHMKRSHNQEEIMKNMHIFEEKLARLTKENQEHAENLQLYDAELPGHHHGHRPASSWGGNPNASPTFFDNSTQGKDPITSYNPTTHFDTTTHGTFSEKLNVAKSATDTKRVGTPSSYESKHLTKRLVHSLHIKKNSDLHLHLADFSDQLYGIPKKDETKKFELMTVEKPEAIASPRSMVNLQSMPALDKFSISPMIKLASYVSSSSHRGSLANLFQGSQTTRTPSLREALTARERPQQTQSTQQPSKKSASEKRKMSNSGPSTSNQALLAKKKERLALDSFKKIREINHNYATSTGKVSESQISQNKFFSVKYIKS